MIPLLPTLGLALLSFFSSAFVILRVLIPILPPHPLSSRVAPKEFGLPNFKSLSATDKAHVWLAVVDLMALLVFVWESLAEYMGGPTDFEVAGNPLSAVRIWFALTARQTCLIVIAAVTLLSVRLGKPVSFGRFHWVVWALTGLVVVTASSVAGILAGVDVQTLFYGVVGYSTSFAISTTVIFTFIIATLAAIRKNLASANADSNEPWPPMRDEKQPRPSFATEDIDGLKDGSSWITSYAGSHRHSMSAFSFSTVQTGMTHGSGHGLNVVTGSTPSLPAKSAFWFGPATPSGRNSPVPPVPPLPAPYRPSSPASDSLHEDPDPFRATPQVPRMGSQSSWLSESSGQATLSAWSFPSSAHGTLGRAATSTTDVRTVLLGGSSRPVTPAFSSAQVLGGYGYAPSPTLTAVEKGLSSFSTSSTKDVDISVHRIIGWLVFIWIPLALALPYLLVISATAKHTVDSVTPILLILAVTLSSPLLAFNVLFCPMPIPVGLFETNTESSMLHALPGTLPSANDFESRYKGSGSVTVVDGRRSGDVWISKGDAVDNRGKFGRAASMLAPVPKLSVLPPSPNPDYEGELTPPLPLQYESPTPSAFGTPQSENSVEIGRNRAESMKSTYSAAGDSLAVATRIMTAQRHYSALAKTMVLPPSPEARSTQFSPTSINLSLMEDKDSAYSSAAETVPSRRSSHLRSRSASSIIKTSVSGPRSPISPPPSSPLPPTPPRKEQTADTSGYSFNAVDDINEIDSLSAKLLPLLIPGLTVGPEMKVKEYSGGQGFSSTSTFSSPEQTSTPVKSSKKNSRSSVRKRHHMSLPSLGLSRDSLQSLSNWKDDITRALASKLSDVTEDGRRKTILGVPESLPNTLSNVRPLNTVAEEEDEIVIQPFTPTSGVSMLGRMMSVRTSSPKDVPAEVNTARSSMATLIAALEMPPTGNTMSSFRSSISEEPVAESTPRYAVVPQVHALTHDQPAASKRRSSIVYIKSDENTLPAGNAVTSRNRGSSGRAPAVRPLIYGQGRNVAGSSKEIKSTDEVSPNGLRRLSLLQQRDMNIVSDSSSSPIDERPTKSGIRPLNLTKKLKPKEVVRTTNPSWAHQNLARSGTNKERATLRKNEVLPAVVIRPPSTSETPGFSFGFR